MFLAHWVFVFRCFFSFLGGSHFGAAGVRMGENGNHIFNFFTQTLTDGGGRLCFLVWVWTQPPPPGMSLVGYVPFLQQFHEHPAQRFLLVILLQTESLSLFCGKSAFIVGREFSALSISSKESTAIGVSSPGWCPPSACLGLASPPLQAVSH